jgi:hypothetical protein
VSVTRYDPAWDIFKLGPTPYQEWLARWEPHFPEYEQMGVRFNEETRRWERIPGMMPLGGLVLPLPPRE